MKQYQRSSESEFERLLVNEDYQEQMEYQEELEELKVEYWRGLVAKFKEDNNWTKSLPCSDVGYDKKIVDKIEKTMEEMREEDSTENEDRKNIERVIEEEMNLKPILFDDWE